MTLISAIGIEEANAELQQKSIRPFSFADTRRDVVLADINPEQLNSLLHKKFKIGEIVMEGMDLCTPCTRPGELIERPVEEQQAFIHAFLQKGGLRVKILRGGPLNKGSSLGYPK